jgi:hypothetical protein
MAYEFQAVDISVFDYHEMLAPLTAPGLTKPGFDFLVDETLYESTYKAGQTIHSTHFDAQPLKWRTLNFHHFWKYYQTIWYPGGQPEFWKLQMPLVCKPTQARIEVVTGSADFNGKVVPTVFLSPNGWSTNLDIMLRGKMTPGQLRDFVGSLPDQKAPLFRASGQSANGQNLNNEPMSLPQVFRFLSEQIKRDVYAPNLVAPVRVKRYLIVTLSEFSGEEIRHYLSPRTDLKQMPEASRQVMHAILGGKPVSLAQLLAMESKQPGHQSFLLTRFNGPDFAITYFDYGTLVFMQQTSVSGFHPPRRKAMQCHSSNLRNYLVMTHALSWFYRDTAKETDPKIVALRKYIKADLEQMPNKLTSPLALTFHANYLKNL